MKIMCLALTAFLWIGLLAALPAADWYVATNGTGGGTSWANATNSLQGAIFASSAADTVWVSNGVYETGGVTNFPTGTLLTNRVAIDKAITVRSLNGAAVTTIKGVWDSASTNGPTAVRCVYMVNNSILIGFTLTNGATLRTNESAQASDRYGGGLYCPSTSPLISNCVIAGNSADSAGGGAYYGTLRDSTVSRNSAAGGGVGGGAYGGTLTNCTIVSNSATYGGGTFAASLYNCTVVGNWAGGGGGTYDSYLYNCTVRGNSTTSGNGGGVRGYAYNCTIVSNTAIGHGGGTDAAYLYNCKIIGNSTGAGSLGGGANESYLYNCTVVGNWAGGGGGVREGTCYSSIIYSNSAGNGFNNWQSPVNFTNSCTTPAVGGWTPGNITNDPAFLAYGSGYGTNHLEGNYRLSASSPAINAGTNFSWMTDPNDVRSKDLDGQPRLRYQAVDMGAYEILLRGTIFTFH